MDQTTTAEGVYRYGGSSRRVRSAGLLILILLAIPLHAQKVEAQRPSPTIATAISGGSLILGIGMIPVAAQFDVTAGAILGVGAGVLTLFGPSLGFVYSGRTWRGVKSSLFRIGAVGLVLTGAGMSWHEDNALGAVLALTGVLAGTGSMVHDVWTGGDAAREERTLRLQAGPAPAGLDVSVRIDF